MKFVRGVKFKELFQMSGVVRFGVSIAKQFINNLFNFIT